MIHENDSLLTFPSPLSLIESGRADLAAAQIDRLLVDPVLLELWLLRLKRAADLAGSRLPTEAVPARGSKHVPWHDAVVRFGAAVSHGMGLLGSSHCVELCSDPELLRGIAERILEEDSRGSWLDDAPESLPGEVQALPARGPGGRLAADDAVGSTPRELDLLVVDPRGVELAPWHRFEVQPGTPGGDPWAGSVELRFSQLPPGAGVELCFVNREGDLSVLREALGLAAEKSWRKVLREAVASGSLPGQITARTDARGDLAVHLPRSPGKRPFHPEWYVLVLVVSAGPGERTEVEGPSRG